MAKRTVFPGLNFGFSKIDLVFRTSDPVLFFRCQIRRVLKVNLLFSCKQPVQFPGQVREIIPGDSFSPYSQKNPGVPGFFFIRLSKINLLYGLPGFQNLLYFFYLFWVQILGIFHWVIINHRPVFRQHSPASILPKGVPRPII